MIPFTSSIRYATPGWFFLLSIVASSLSGQEKSSFQSYLIMEHKKNLDKHQKELMVLHREKTDLTVAYDSAVYQIAYWKQVKEPGLFDRVKLKNMLKESEDLSRRITQLDYQIIHRQDAIRGVIDKMIPLMEMEIMDMLKSIETLSGDQRSAATDRLQAMINEKMDYQTYLAEPIRARIQEIRYQRSDDPEVLMDKSDFLLDQADKLQRYVDILNDRIERFETEEEIRKQASRFIDDIYAFDKDREMKVGTRKAGKETDNHPALTTRTGRGEETELPVNYDPGIRTGGNSTPYQLLVTTTLELSALRINVYDDLPTIIRKLKHEKSLALYRIQSIRKTAEEIRHLAEIKLRYSR